MLTVLGNVSLCCFNDTFSHWESTFVQINDLILCICWLHCACKVFFLNTVTRFLSAVRCDFAASTLIPVFCSSSSLAPFQTLFWSIPCLILPDECFIIWFWSILKHLWGQIKQTRSHVNTKKWGKDGAVSRRHSAALRIKKTKQKNTE